MQHLLLFVTFGLFLFSCRPTETERISVSDEQHITYGINRFMIEEGIEVLADLRLHRASGIIIASLDFENNNSREQEIDLSEIYLESINGTRSDPIRTDSTILQLNSSESKKVKFEFRPINNLYLYRLTGLHGDPSPTYSLNFSNVNSRSVPYLADSIAYANHIQKSGIESKLKVWQIKADDMEFQETLASSLFDAAFFENPKFNSADANQLNFQVTENEILFGGLVVGVRCYQIESKLILDLKVVNHQSNNLELDLRKVRIDDTPELSQDTIVFASSNSPHLQNGTELTFRKGDRGRFKIEFKTGILQEDPKIHLPIIIAGSDFLLFEPIPLKKANWPIQE